MSAPNKMEIYGEYMPYYCLEDKSDGNYELLMDELSHTDVDYIDLKEILKEAGGGSSVQLYHKEDSHWNNLGAAYAYRAIMQKAGVDFLIIRLLIIRYRIISTAIYIQCFFLKEATRMSR